MADPVTGDPIYRDPEWLREKYWEEEMSLNEMAEEAGCAYNAVWRWMDKHDIERRTNANHVEITGTLRNILDGLIAGDGSLWHEDAASHYSHGDSYLEHIDWLVQLLADHGLETNTRWVTDGEDWTAYHFHTRAYRELEEFNDRWYDENGKRLPPDFELSPTTLKLWYVGDGSYIPQQKNSTHNAIIYSDTFVNEKDRLERMFADKLDIDVTYMQKGIYIPAGDHKIFFDYMAESDLEPAGYDYKFPDTG